MILFDGLTTFLSSALLDCMVIGHWWILLMGFHQMNCSCKPGLIVGLCLWFHQWFNLCSYQGGGLLYNCVKAIFSQMSRLLFHSTAVIQTIFTTQPDMCGIKNGGTQGTWLSRKCKKVKIVGQETSRTSNFHEIWYISSNNGTIEQSHKPRSLTSIA